MNPPDISHLIDKSDPGAWKNALKYGIHIKIIKEGLNMTEPQDEEHEIWDDKNYMRIGCLLCVASGLVTIVLIATALKALGVLG